MGLHPRADGSWDVITDAGNLVALHVVNAAGLWAREVGAMAGVYVPAHPLEHQYLVTEDIPEVYERGEELPQAEAARPSSPPPRRPFGGGRRHQSSRHR